MSRLEKHILAKVISLTKGIRSQEPKARAASLASFYSGTKADFPLSTGMIVQWWLTERAEIDSLDIAHMAMLNDPSLKDGDQKTFSRVIMSTLQKNAWNTELFNGGSFFSKHVPTLFNAKKIKHSQEFARKLWEVIHRSLLDSITEWLVLYPLPRIKSRSISLGFDGISLLRADDKGTWQDLSEKYFWIKHWSPLTGEHGAGQKLPFSITQYRLAQPLTWLACERKGTELGATKNSRKLVSTFLSVLFSHLRIRDPRVLDKIIDDSPLPFFRFSASKQIYSGTRPIFYRLKDEIEILEEDLEFIYNWYIKFSKISEERQRRTRLCTQFMQKGMNDRGTDEFIYYFIALDALFGIRGNVERSIADGISNIFINDKKWMEKVGWLFDLRSDILHGGSSEIEDWEKLPRYIRYFKTEPLKDVGFAAMTSLMIYPELDEVVLSPDSRISAILKRLITYFKRLYFRVLSIHNPTY